MIIIAKRPVRLLTDEKQKPLMDDTNSGFEINKMFSPRVYLNRKYICEPQGEFI